MRSLQVRALALGVLVLSSFGAYLAFRTPPPVPTPTKQNDSTSEPRAVASSTAETRRQAPLGNPAALAPEATAPATPSELPRYQGPVRNAEQAALIREALIARKAVQSGTMPEPKGTGNQFDKPLGKYVARTMQEQFLPLATECYEALLSTHPAAAGNVALEFSVLGDPAVGGVVVDVTLGKETTLTNDEFRNCMSESMYSVVFDAPPGKDGSVSVKQSFELAP